MNLETRGLEMRKVRSDMVDEVMSLRAAKDDTKYPGERVDKRETEVEWLQKDPKCISKLDSELKINLDPHMSNLGVTSANLVSF